MMWITGVYLIRNEINKKVYIGGAYKSFNLRFRQHITLLNRGKHHNRHLQAAWDKYGSNSFSYEILERCPKNMVLENEQKWLDFYKAANPDYGYNICSKAGSTTGVKYSEESKEKLRGKKLSEEARRKISEAMKERWRNNPYPKESIEKMAAKHRGKKRPEHSKKMSELMNEGKKTKLKKVDKGIMTEYTRMLVSNNSTNISDECRRKRSEAAKAQWARIKARKELLEIEDLLSE